MKNSFNKNSNNSAKNSNVNNMSKYKSINKNWYNNKLKAITNLRVSNYKINLRVSNYKQLTGVNNFKSNNKNFKWNNLKKMTLFDKFAFNNSLLIIHPR